MLNNLQQLPPWLWVVAIAVILLVSAGIIWARRREWHVKEIEVPVGPVKVKLEPKSLSVPPDLPEPASVNIRRNRVIGEAKISVRHEGTNIFDNLIVGKTEIEVGGKPGPKPKPEKVKRRK